MPLFFRFEPFWPSYGHFAVFVPYSHFVWGKMKKMEFLLIPEPYMKIKKNEILLIPALKLKKKKNIF